MSWNQETTRMTGAYEPSNGPEPVVSGFRAQAFLGDRLLADSSAPLIEERTGLGAMLHFPQGDVDAAAGDLAIRSRPGFVTFLDPEVRLVVIDPMEGRDPRDVTSKRFPTWGDLSHLLEILDLTETGPGRFVSVAHADEQRPVVEGSQMLGQAMLAASRLAPGRRVTSAHMIFLRGADARLPLEFQLEELAVGRTFANFSANVSQDGRLRAAGILQLDVTAPDFFRHAAPPPPCAGPYESEPLDMVTTGRDVRVVDGAYTDDPDAPVGPPVIDAWVRFRSLPAEPALHAALLAQFTGHMPIAAAFRPYAGVGQVAAHRTISTAINAITVSIHADVRADQWMRYHHHNTFAGSGMTHSECRVYTEDDQLIASFTVDAMVRGFSDPTKPVDDRTAM